MTKEKKTELTLMSVSKFSVEKMAHCVDLSKGMK